MSKRFYNNLRTEPDMRQELINTLNGSFPEISKKITVALRKMRRGTLEVYLEGTITSPWTEVDVLGRRHRWRTDVGNNMLPCACTDKVTKEPDKDTFCPFCWGEGFIWDEGFMNTYKVDIRADTGNALLDRPRSPGLIASPLVVFYTDYSPNITKEDKVVGLVLNSNGTLAKPYFRNKIYRIGNAIDLRADNGKLEFWKLDCYTEYRKFLNGSGG